MPQIFSTGTSPEKKRDVVKEWPDFEEKGSYRVLENLKNSTNFGKIAVH